MKKLLALAATIGLGLSMIGCEAPKPAPPANPPAAEKKDAPPAEGEKKDAPAEEKK